MNFYYFLRLESSGDGVFSSNSSSSFGGMKHNRRSSLLSESRLYELTLYLSVICDLTRSCSGLFFEGSIAKFATLSSLLKLALVLPMKIDFLMSYFCRSLEFKLNSHTLKFSGREDLSRLCGDPFEAVVV